METKQQLLLEQQNERQRNLYYKLDNILYEVKNADGYRSNSDTFKNFEISVRLLQDKLQKDYYRSESVIRRRIESDEKRGLQQALNRERKLRQELEDKINEATTSSGLFIKYVRDKLGV